MVTVFIALKNYSTLYFNYSTYYTYYARPKYYYTKLYVACILQKTTDHTTQNYKSCYTNYKPCCAKLQTELCPYALHTSYVDLTRYNILCVLFSIGADNREGEERIYCHTSMELYISI